MYYHAGIRLVNTVLERNGFRYTRKRERQNVMWSTQHLKPSEFQAMQRHQRVNQFPRTYECTRKDSLSRNISRMSAVHGRRHFDFLPHSFILPKEREQLLAQAQKDPSVPWIIKPATSACGRGIYITNDCSDFPTEGLDEFVAERYINNPLCVNGFKIDLRIYVAVTSFNPLKIYVHEEGLCRFASEKYSTAEGYENAFVHLTNYSINKFNDKFEQNKDENVDDEGGKWSLGALKRHLLERGINVDALWEGIHDIIIKTMVSIETQVTSACDMFVPHRSSCFELFGFDILIDDQLRPFLLEVNFSPSLQCDSPLDLKIKAGVVSDILNLTGVKQQQSKRGSKNNSKKTQQRGQGQQQQGPGQGQSSQQQPRSRNNLDDEVLRSFAPEHQRVIRETEDEFDRVGGFQRIFPLGESAYQYKRFFEEERELNTVLANYYFCKTTGMVMSAYDDENGIGLRELAQEQKRHERAQRRLKAEAGGNGNDMNAGMSSSKPGGLVNKFREQMHGS